MNKAHALDLYLVFMSRTHFEQSVGESIFLNYTSESSEPAIMMYTRCHQLLLMLDFKTLNKRGKTSQQG
jgi:hypothetical protein